MTKNKLIVTLILIMFTFNKLFAQTQNTGNYIIVTQENEYSNGLEGIIRKYWIIPEDSIISSDRIKISPLILSLYYKNHIDSCIKGLDIDPITDPSMDLLPIDSLQDQALHKLFYLTRKNRKKIQTVEKKWTAGYWNTTTYYATSVTGNFCSCRFDEAVRYRSGYQGPIFIVNDKITSYDDFWDTPKAKILVKKDFTTFNLDYNLKLNVFRNGKKF